MAWHLKRKKFTNVSRETLTQTLSTTFKITTKSDKQKHLGYCELAG